MEIITAKNYIYKIDSTNPRWRKDCFDAHQRLHNEGFFNNLAVKEKWLKDSNISEAELMQILKEFEITENHNN